MKPMKQLLPSNGRKLTRVAVIATLKLVSESLCALLQGERGTIVECYSGSHSELLETARNISPDVVLLCLMEDEERQIGLIAELTKLLPEAKLVVLSSPNGDLDKPGSLKLGVKGIVGSNQNARVLRRAIQQVSEGELWLNQKLVEQLLGGNGGGQSQQRSNKSHRAYDLTKREIEIIKMVTTGLNNKDIAKSLGISEATVRHHLSSIYSKLCIEDRLNLAIFAYQKGIVKLADR